MATAKITLSGSRDILFNKLVLRPLSERLITELTAHRTLALRDALANDPGVAFTTVLHALCLGAFYRISSGTCLEILAKSATFTTHALGLADSASAKAIEIRQQQWAKQLPQNEDDLWDALGLLSEAQLESVIYAGDAHAGYLAGSRTIDDTFDIVSAAPDDAENAVCFRRDWFLGDGTGAGKGRQVAGILLDNWLQARRRAVWISESDKLIEDAQRDWSALGQERLLITPLAPFRQGTPIRLDQGILFTTYATLRSDVREEKVSRAQQIVDWLGRIFDGVIVFDESHAMLNAAGEKTERGEKALFQQGRAIGLISEIVAWKLRLFVPIGACGPGILAKVMERHSLVRIADKAVA